MGKTTQPTRASDIVTIAAFVVRARRIAAHSLAQDVEVLRRQAREFGRLDVGPDGMVTITRSLPDEERFESFAARIRPLTLGSEPICYHKVLAALDRLIESSEEDLSDIAQAWSKLRQEWQTWDLENLQMRGYFLRQVQPEGWGLMATDGQLGAGWFYADVAHADPKHGKAVALDYPLVERYAAAVAVFSGLALVVLGTLHLTETLSERGVLSLPDAAWSTDVVVPAGDLVREAQAHVAPTGTPVPEAGVLGPEWQPVSQSEVERQLGIFRLTARLFDGDGREVGVRPAVTRRRIGEGRIEGVDLRLDGAVDIHLPLPGGVADGVLRADFVESTTNEELCHQVSIREELRSTQRILLEDPDGSTVMRLQLACDLPTSAEDDRRIREACADLVALERVTGTVLPCLVVVPSLEELNRLRSLRQVMSGAVTHGPSGSIEVTTAGELPQLVHIPAHQEVIGDVSLEIPSLVLWHPRMIVERLPSPGGSEVPVAFRISVPPGERFLMWSPEHHEIAEVDLDTVQQRSESESGESCERAVKGGSVDA